ncbi:hypothetical protein [Paenibacillus sp. EPM92]|uniref:hypothetical protein n=1 Tax=Paenibacillus sp. EPM92 TaxID=1561195 RepID=UPI001914DC37|nr:hypothetical protein [Paenibacillus sp. EPM92]
MADNRISFRLRKVDGDLLEATKDLSSDRISDLARDGLRLILGIKTTKRVEVTERPISVTQASDIRRTEVIPQQRTIPGKPAVFVPGQQRR